MINMGKKFTSGSNKITGRNGATHSQDVHPPREKLDLLTWHAKLRLRPVLFFLGCLAVLGFASYLKPEPYRAAYGSLATLAAMALFVQYRRERRLVRNRLSAIGVVTDYRVRGKG